MQHDQTCERCHQPFETYEWNGRTFPRYRSCILTGANGRIRSARLCPSCAALGARGKPGQPAPVKAIVIE